VVKIFRGLLSTPIDSEIILFVYFEPAIDRVRVISPRNSRTLAPEQTAAGIQPARFVYLNLLWSNLGVHPLRSALSAAAIGLQVFLILLIVGLTSGILSDWRARA